MKKDDKILFSEQDIQSKVKQIAGQISNDFKAKEDEGIVVVGILTGSFMFMADLVRNLKFVHEIDFIQASSYKNSTSSSGYVKVKKDLTTILNSKHVLVVEDIVETGTTIKHIKKLFKDRHALSVSVCALLVKNNPEAHKLIDYKCFDCPDEFVVGYGLDYAQKYRNLPYITSLESQVKE